jgi:hypothetical protein
VVHNRTLMGFETLSLYLRFTHTRRQAQMMPPSLNPGKHQPRGSILPLSLVPRSALSACDKCISRCESRKTTRCHWSLVNQEHSATIHIRQTCRKLTLSTVAKPSSTTDKRFDGTYPVNYRNRVVAQLTGQYKTGDLNIYSIGLLPVVGTILPGDSSSALAYALRQG